MVDLIKSAQVFIDTPEGPQPVKRQFGKKLNFLYDAWVQACAANVGVHAARVALYAEIREYFGVVVLKEARKNGAHGIPRSGALIINRLVPESDISSTRDSAVDEVFQALPTFTGWSTKHKRKSRFSTWLYAVVRNVIVDAIREEQKRRIAATPLADPNITKGRSGAKMMKNLQEDREIRRLDHVVHGEVERDSLEKKRQEWNALYWQQSRADRRFLRLHVQDHPGQNRNIARMMGWSFSKARNRKAKFVKLGLLPRIQPDRKKQQYNARYRAKLQIRN